MQQLALLMFRIAHQIENDNAAMDTNLSSNPWSGKIANPPTIPKTAVSDVVHAGHPGVNAASAPPNIADDPPFCKFILCVFMLYATSAMLIPPSTATTNVNPIEAARYWGLTTNAIKLWSIALDKVRK